MTQTKRTNNDLQDITQKTKYGAARSPLIPVEIHSWCQDIPVNTV